MCLALKELLWGLSFIEVYKSIAFALYVDCKIVESIVQDFDLFKNDGEKFWSNSVNARLNKRKTVSEKRKLAAINRWKSTQENQGQSNINANTMQDISKEKESKDISIYRKGKSKNRQTVLPSHKKLILLFLYSSQNTIGKI